MGRSHRQRDLQYSSGFLEHRLHIGHKFSLFRWYCVSNPRASLADVLDKVASDPERGGKVFRVSRLAVELTSSFKTQRIASHNGFDLRIWLVSGPSRWSDPATDIPFTAPVTAFRDFEVHRDRACGRHCDWTVNGLSR